MNWTEERDTQLRKLRDAGLTFSQIAAAFGMTNSAVIGRADRLGLAKQGQPATRSNQKRRITVQEQSLPPTLATGSVALLDLEPHHCRWPVQDVPYLFCADAKIDSSSYCGYHFGVSKRGGGGHHDQVSGLWL